MSLDSVDDLLHARPHIHVESSLIAGAFAIGLIDGVLADKAGLTAQ